VDRVTPEKPCCICHEACLAAGSLSDGSVFHNNCYEELTKPKYSKELSEVQSIISRWENMVKQKSTLGSSLKRLFVADKELEKLTIELNHMRRKKEQLRKFEEIHYKESSEKLHRLYDYWLDYPPDWSERSKTMVRNAGKMCEECYTSARRGHPLHVHHKTTIAKGGSHKPDNLVVLCEKCHSKAHGGKQFGTTQKSSNGTAFSRNLKMINNAIKSGALIQFNYRKYEGEKSTRTITPKATEKVGQSLCVKGYCHLRKAERVFAIKRMSGLTNV